MLPSIENCSPRTHILIKNARLHNLKGIDLAIPRGRLVVVTGLSGSGKSSLIFDTLYAEGQRRYVESLSSYARQFFNRMKKPEVDYIHGISPAVAIEQKTGGRNPRSTVGTTTEIYDYLKLLFARIGETRSPVSGAVVKRHTVDEVVEEILLRPDEQTCEIRCPLVRHERRTLLDECKVLLQKGFLRVRIDNDLFRIEDWLVQQEQAVAVAPQSPSTGKKESSESDPWAKLSVEVVVDRITTDRSDADLRSRLSDSVQTAFFEGRGACLVDWGDQVMTYSDRFEADGLVFEEPSVNLFSFSNPYGACRRCEGFGTILGIDPDLVVPDKSLSVYEGCIAPWKGEKMNEWLKPLVRHGIKFDFPIHRPFHLLSDSEKELLWTGNSWFEGLHAFFAYLERESFKIQYRVMLSRYRGRTVCPDCKGSRIRKDAAYVYLPSVDRQASMNLPDLTLLPVDQSLHFLRQLNLPPALRQVADRLLKEIITRLSLLCEVGLSYLTLHRPTQTLSGGEYQRIRLATSLGSTLAGSLYILDEPSVGLHARDSARLVEVLRRLRDAGNTVVVVEHDETIISAADHLIDIGPAAGSGGGQLIYQGDYSGLLSCAESPTGAALRELNTKVGAPTRASWHTGITVHGARAHNLKNLTLTLPLHCITVITGVSGSGKSTLIKQIVYPAMLRMRNESSEKAGDHDRIEGPVQRLQLIELVHQDSIGKSSRSNPVTYTKAYDGIRQLFAAQPASQAMGLSASHFSFNVPGGRCETCQGEGTVTISMQFLADLTLPCDDCGGMRFGPSVLGVRYREKTIYDVLCMTVDDALLFFHDQHSVVTRLKPLSDVGLGYMSLGQSSSTLSGGEAQRMKLASYLTHGQQARNALFIFDEPTTGLHFHDVRKLMEALAALQKQGNSIWIIEHNPDVIRAADWVIDLGPEGGRDGGHLVFEGTPDQLLDCSESHTGQQLSGHSGG
ncbi:MAG: excinuclease ABC subunit A [Bacteroidetes bacterium]|nr:excinuclease ABC subunit A [Bacteroidota bacterium]